LASFQHDMLTPINVMRGLSEEAINLADDPRERRLLHHSLNQLTALEWHCQNIMDTCRPERQTLPSNLAPIYVDDTIKEVLDMF